MDKLYCCKDLQRFSNFSCQDHKNPFDCPDAIISYNKIFNEYGVIIHDGGTSKIMINFCPWCGNKLPDSKRDQWYDELEKLGFKNPSEEEIPQVYLSDEWYLLNKS